MSRGSSNDLSQAEWINIASFCDIPYVATLLQVNRDINAALDDNAAWEVLLYRDAPSDLVPHEAPCLAAMYPFVDRLTPSLEVTWHRILRDLEDEQARGDDSDGLQVVPLAALPAGLMRRTYFELRLRRFRVLRSLYDDTADNARSWLPLEVNFWRQLRLARGHRRVYEDQPVIKMGAVGKLHFAPWVERPVLQRGFINPKTDQPVALTRAMTGPADQDPQIRNLAMKRRMRLLQQQRLRAATRRRRLAVHGGGDDEEEEARRRLAAAEALVEDDERFRMAEDRADAYVPTVSEMRPLLETLSIRAGFFAGLAAARGQLIRSFAMLGGSLYMAQIVFTSRVEVYVRNLPPYRWLRKFAWYRKYEGAARRLGHWMHTAAFTPEDSTHASAMDEYGVPIPTKLSLTTLWHTFATAARSILPPSVQTMLSADYPHVRSLAALCPLAVARVHLCESHSDAWATRGFLSTAIVNWLQQCVVDQAMIGLVPPLLGTLYTRIGMMYATGFRRVAIGLCSVVGSFCLIAMAKAQAPRKKRAARIALLACVATYVASKLLHPLRPMATATAAFASMLTPTAAPRLSAASLDPHDWDGKSSFLVSQAVRAAVAAAIRVFWYVRRRGINGASGTGIGTALSNPTNRLSAALCHAIGRGEEPVVGATSDTKDQSSADANSGASRARHRTSTIVGALLIAAEEAILGATDIGAIVLNDGNTFSCVGVRIGITSIAHAVSVLSVMARGRPNLPLKCNSAD